MSAPDPKSLSALKNQGNNPAAAKAVAGQFAALLMQNVMQSSDGAALPMAGDGIGGNIVSGLFASAVSQAAASGDKLGLADILFRAIEAKQRSAAPGSGKTEMPATAPPGAQAVSARAVTRRERIGFPLRPYWQGNGLRPLAASVSAGSASADSADRSIAGASQARWEPYRPCCRERYTGGDIRVDCDHSRSPAMYPACRRRRGRLNPLSGSSARSWRRQAGSLASRQASCSHMPRSRPAGAAPCLGNNLFGIKAGPSWQGAQTTTLTHEVENGERVAREAAFRAYPNLDASVQDYVALIGGSPRYQGLIGLGNDAVAYGRGLVAGGYATDPDYGSKLEAVAAEAAAAFATPSGPAPVGPFATTSEPGRLELFATPGSME